MDIGRTQIPQRVGRVQLIVRLVRKERTRARRVNITYSCTRAAVWSHVRQRTTKPTITLAPNATIRVTHALDQRKTNA